MLLQGYVERSDEAEGLALLPLFIGARAAIRAKVEGFAADVQQEDGRAPAARGAARPLPRCWRDGRWSPPRRD